MAWHLAPIGRWPGIRLPERFFHTLHHAWGWHIGLGLLQHLHHAPHVRGIIPERQNARAWHGDDAIGQLREGLRDGDSLLRLVFFKRDDVKELESGNCSGGNSTIGGDSVPTMAAGTTFTYFVPR